MKSRKKYFIIGIIISLLFFFIAEMRVQAAEIVELSDIKTVLIVEPTPAPSCEPSPSPRPYSDEELRHLSALIYAEAGNQCEAGQQAVGIVVMERVKYENWFEDDIISVIYEPRQFTPVRNGALNKALKEYDEETIPQSCIDAAIYALEGNTEIKYERMTYNLKGFLFFSRKLKNSRVVIEDHEFK